MPEVRLISGFLRGNISSGNRPSLSEIGLPVVSDNWHFFFRSRFYISAPFGNFKFRSPRGFLPRPLLRAGIRIQNHETELDKANHIPRKIVSPCPPQSVTLPRIEFRQFLPQGKTRPRPPPPYQKKKTESAEHKKECVVARRGRNGTAVAERHCFRSVS